jgi:hypothetical protein
VDAFIGSSSSKSDGDVPWCGHCCTLV